MYVYLVVEVDLETNKERNVAIFSKKDEAEKFIANGKSADYFDYGITKFLLDDYDHYEYKSIED